MKAEQELWNLKKRRATDKLMTSLAFLCVVAVLVPLLSMIFTVVSKGVVALNFELFTQLPKPAGELGGGIGNAILGTFIVVGIACLISLPVGIFAGVYLSEYENNPFASGIRFISDVMSSTPSIIAGMFGYTTVVLSLGTFSALAGGVALSLLIVPIIARTVEESLKLVPLELREASLALGIKKWRTILSIVLSTARAGIITAVILAIARAAGETAPLLFTSGMSNNWPAGITQQPVATLPVLIFTYAISPFKDWQAKAWAGALVLMLLVLFLSVGIRIATKGKQTGVRF